MMDSKKSSNKIREIVRLQQLLKKWKKVAHASKINANNNTNYITLPPIKRSSSSSNTNFTTNPTNNPTSSGSKSIKFLKKTLSFTDISIMSSISSSSTDVVPKGSLAVSVGRDDEEKKRFVIPMEYLGHQTFGVLLREAEEEFGFQQEGVLKIPCEVALFQNILKMMQQKKKNEVAMFLHDEEDNSFGTDEQKGCLYSSPDRHSCEPTPSHQPQLCR